MAEELFVTRFIMELMPIAASSVSEEDLSKKFIESVKGAFGLDGAELSGVANEGKGGAMEDYIINTRKPHVDNQLSEYSSFPELIDYKNKNYRSCAVIPLVANGRVALILKLLSKEENKFNENTMRAVEMITGFFSFSLMYKSEIRKNSRLAEYFDSSFNSSVPQMLVSSDDNIIKANSSAVKAFEVVSGRQKIRDVFNMGFEDAKLIGDKGRDVYCNINNSHNVYRLTSRKISDALLHISAQNITGKVIVDSLLESISNNNDIYMVLARNDFTIITASRNFEKLLKYSESMLPKKRFTDFIKENEAQTLVNTLKESGEEALVVPLNLRGGDFTVSARAIIKKTAFGYLMTLVNTEAENYIKESSENINSFIESTSDIIITVDEFGYIKGCNMPVENVLGYAKEELVGRAVREFYKEPSTFDRDITYVRNGSKVDNSLVNIIKKNLDVVSGVQSVRLLRGTSNEGRYMIVIKELETKRRLEDMEMSLKERDSKIKKLESVGERKSEFIYNISHELKTPLTNIKGFSSLLYNGNAGELTKSEKDYVSTIMEESDRLMLIIQQVLDAAKLEADKVKLDFKDFDLKTIYNNPTIKSLEESALNKGLEFKWEADKSLPNVSCDPNRLIQVFVNLIGNAVKFTDKGGITVHMFLKTKRAVECDVIDTGIGISEDDRKKLFKKFYQAQKKTLAKQDGAGTGLGLSITRDIVRLHGGKINAESTLGVGSRFWFTLPLTRRKQKEKVD